MSDKTPAETLLARIHSIIQNDCNSDCPNFPNKPKGEGCGMAKCLDVIADLTKDYAAKPDKPQIYLGDGTIKLSEVQQAFLQSLFEPGEVTEYWECDRSEYRTSEALRKKGLVEYSDHHTQAFEKFMARMTNKAREMYFPNEGQR